MEMEKRENRTGEVQFRQISGAVPVGRERGQVAEGEGTVTPNVYTNAADSYVQAT